MHIKNRVRIYAIVFICVLNYNICSEVIIFRCLTVRETSAEIEYLPTLIINKTLVKDLASLIFQFLHKIYYSEICNVMHLICIDAICESYEICSNNINPAILLTNIF